VEGWEEEVAVSTILTSSHQIWRLCLDLVVPGHPCTHVACASAEMATSGTEQSCSCRYSLFLCTSHRHPPASVHWRSSPRAARILELDGDHGRNDEGMDRSRHCSDCLTCENRACYASEIELHQRPVPLGWGLSNYKQGIDHSEQKITYISKFEIFIEKTHV